MLSTMPFVEVRLTILLVTSSTKVQNLPSCNALTRMTQASMLLLMLTFGCK